MDIILYTVEALALLIITAISNLFIWIMFDFFKKRDEIKVLGEDIEHYLRNVLGGKNIKMKPSHIVTIFLSSSIVMGAHMFFTIKEINEKTYPVFDQYTGCATLLRIEDGIMVVIPLHEEKEEMSDLYVFLSCRHKGEEDLRNILYENKPSKVTL